MHLPSILTVVQARMGSSRLPGKILLPLAGQPLLVRMVERVQRAHLAGTVVVATTTDAADDAVAECCAAHGLECFRGDALDLLDRHYQAARHYGADVVLKIPSDCPLIDPAIIDEVVGYYLHFADRYDFVSNLHPATFPDGNDVEVMPFTALETAWREARRPLEREHTTPFFWENSDRFRLGNVAWDTGQDYSMSHRWTIDYPEDYDFINAVYEALYASNPAFGLDDILTLLNKRPDIAQLNARYAGVNWYRNHLDELKTVDPSQTRKI
ncbi:cytidylyltransferase domain-containing protein [Hymenobacter arizonensis]|uniref:Spore coat polysaccharide biosynthesis protein SpsF n=1 Tax=Hymenobacter arizonensis TaxID=1227077 RepID=A0A1I5VDU2_HYMAR|nr:glycosyltransferase family protein [Hymenobacter arizonensis]SFQ05551.1 spore coat polysaccharide biosynthesis protein SpsF [Hymenobacter arizonensis]